jgi:hypothetical protein
LAVELDYQQTPMPGGSEFPQTCMCAKMKNLNQKNDLQFSKLHEKIEKGKGSYRSTVIILPERYHDSTYLLKIA